ncbi:MAG: hypothetical protein M3Z87_17445 [Lactobacillus sp.]|nr:hypothetical protein [Lactobacillus sp.]
MEIKLLSFEEIPFGELTQDYIFETPIQFKPKNEITGKICAVYLNPNNIQNDENYIEWTSGEKEYMIRKGNKLYMKTNYLMVKVS